MEQRECSSQGDEAAPVVYFLPPARLHFPKVPEPLQTARPSENQVFNELSPERAFLVPTSAVCRALPPVCGTGHQSVKLPSVSGQETPLYGLSWRSEMTCEVTAL